MPRPAETPVVLDVAHALLRAVSALVPTPLDRESSEWRQECGTILGRNVSGATNLWPCGRWWPGLLVAHALLRAVSALLPALGVFAIQRQRHECRCGTHECVRHFSPPAFPVACRQVCGEWRRARRSVGTPARQAKIGMKIAPPHCVFEGACAIGVLGHHRPHSERFVVPETFPTGIVPRSCRRLGPRKTATTTSCTTKHMLSVEGNGL